MSIKIFLIMLLSLAVASAHGCCRGYKIFQFRRAGIIPMYPNSSPCESLYAPQDDYYDSSLYPTESMSKYEEPDSRYCSSYLEPKAVTHKCVCSKSIASQRMITSVPRYYKRGYCADSMLSSCCGPYSSGSYSDCGQYTPCSSYGQCSSCSQACSMPPLYRPPPHRVLPLTLPASCVC